LKNYALKFGICSAFLGATLQTNFRSPLKTLLSLSFLLFLERKSRKERERSKEKEKRKRTLLGFYKNIYVLFSSF